ncbi:MAG TPA: prepilin-type N-terminal cleavage/methylation domain-containing protein [Verrucomicrobiae bacterium]|nr:prepilin-type N-terminal cleavage/methylation domain-containing protein [Verrucomicrobiae bacterium]
MRQRQAGYTLVELMVTLAVLAVLSLSAFTLFTSLLHSAIVTQRQAVATSLATSQMEYLKTLPYDHLAIAGGPIISSNTIPGSFTKKIQNVTYTITTTISYADDAYDGCGSYPNQSLKQQYCRNYPPPSGTPSVDTNPGDYKDVSVSVTDPSGTRLASVDTQISALVAETASNTGALFVSVVDDSGQPVSGATVNVTNSFTTPAVNVTDTTDQNGIAIFYDLPPSTTNFRYQITGSESGYSTLTTIAPGGSLQPTYPNQNLIAQSSSYVTLTLKQQGTNSLAIETTDTAGNPLPGVKVYVKGGYKKYTATSDTSYYYDNMTPSDTRPTTDSGGLAALTNLVPGGYIFCGDAGATNCKIGNTTYYLAAAVPYGGNNSLQPITVPTYDPSNPPSTTFSYNGSNYLQKVRLMLTTNSSFPRVSSLSPYDVSTSGGTLSNFGFTIKGTNLPCSSSAGSCSTGVKFVQGSSTFTASCTGSSAGVQLNCTVNLTGAVVGTAQLIVTVGGNTLSLPTDPLQGGLGVNP